MPLPLRRIGRDWFCTRDRGRIIRPELHLGRLGPLVPRWRASSARAQGLPLHRAGPKPRGLIRLQSRQAPLNRLFQVISVHLGCRCTRFENWLLAQSGGRCLLPDVSGCGCNALPSPARDTFIKRMNRPGSALGPNMKCGLRLLRIHSHVTHGKVIRSQIIVREVVSDVRSCYSKT
jgi:hypothetical protein